MVGGTKMGCLFVLLSVVVTVVIAGSKSDEVQQIIANFSESVVNNFDKIAADAKDISSSGVARTNDVVAGITGEIRLETEAFEKEMNGMIARGEVQEECALQELSELGVTVNDAIEKVKACNDDNTKVLIAFEESIVTSVTQLKLSLGDLIELVKECKDDKACVMVKVNASKELFLDTIDKFEGAIEQARAQISNIIESTKDCALSILQNVMQRQQEIGNKINNCF